MIRERGEIQLNNRQRIVPREFMGTKQYYLFHGNQCVRLLDYEEVEALKEWAI